ncbi:MAG: ring-cleaving dioxygenase [Rhodothermales bacterium]
MPLPISGLHHVSAIAGPPQSNVDFYVGVLGLCLVKRTVNFDDPSAYHLYYGDATGRPGTAMTTFPWPNAVPGRAGAGMTAATAFSVPADALDFWMGRFADRALDFDAPTERFGEAVLAFADPDGLPLELVAHDAAPDAIPDAHAIRGFHSVTLALADPTPTARVLTDVFGWDDGGEEGGRLRFRAPDGGPASVVDLVQTDERGRPGAGTVHHVAFRARDDDEQRAWRDALRTAGLHPTEVKDRQYFRSIYCREPGGVLFEIATDGPGFTTDEAAADLGTALKLPPWLESRRDAIAQRLPPLTLPTSR